MRTTQDNLFRLLSIWIDTASSSGFILRTNGEVSRGRLQYNNPPRPGYVVFDQENSCSFDSQWLQRESIEITTGHEPPQWVEVFLSGNPIVARHVLVAQRQRPEPLRAYAGADALPRQTLTAAQQLVRRAAGAYVGAKMQERFQWLA